MSGGHRPGPETPRERALARRETQEDTAVGLGLFTLLRDLERKAGELPRIGRNVRLRDALVRLGQDPYLAFPDRDLARVDLDRVPPLVRAQFIGMFGAFGALPLNWTEDVRRWFEAGDESFVDFVDIFAARFQELFFRAWSDAQAITQFDHAGDDRFLTWLLALVGTGSPAWRDHGALPDTVRAWFTPLAMGRVKSPVRLMQILALQFDGRAQVEIQEMLPSWLEFEPDAVSRLGAAGSTLGRDIHLGSRVRSIGEKIRIDIHVSTLAAYRRFLPGGPDHTQLRDIVFWYLGQAWEIDIALWLPEPELRPARLDGQAQLGWMAWLAPRPGVDEDMVRATVYRLEPARKDDAPRPGMRAA